VDDPPVFRHSRLKLGSQELVCSSGQRKLIDKSVTLCIIKGW
jgi:hypothetical protein